MAKLVDETTGPALRLARPGAWLVCWLMFGSTVLNYMDRQAMTLVGEDIRSEFGIDNQGFGWVLAAFQLTYAFFQVPAGFLVDRGDVRSTYAFAVAWWSLAGMCCAFSPTLGVLLSLRALLGVGESFNWPCALRVTGQILPPADRGLGNGIFNSGAAIGAVLTPLTVPFLVRSQGWRFAFFVLGALGFLWVGMWTWATYRSGLANLFVRTEVEPRLASDEGTYSVRAKGVFLGLAGASSLVTATSLRFGPGAVWCGLALFMFGLLTLVRLLPPDEMKPGGWGASLSEVVRHRRFWILVIVSISINVCWHFLVNWLPTYLKSDRGMTYLVGSALSSLPFVAADFGNIGGGAASRWLSARGLSSARSRVTVMGACTLLISSGAWVGALQSDALILTLLACMGLGAAAFMANYFAFCQDVAPRHTGLIVGILGGLGNLLSAGFLPIAGWVKDTTGSFGPVFVIVGILPFVGVLALLLGWGWSEAGEVS